MELLRIPGILFLMLFMLANHLEAQEKNIVNVSCSPHNRMMGIDMNDVRWTEGFWADRFRICMDSMVPSMWQILNNPMISHAFRNFEIAAGEKEGCHKGPPFHDGDFYKWFETLKDISINEVIFDNIH